MGKTTVECLICRKAMRIITHTHTMKHGLTHAEYQEMYPEADVGRKRANDNHDDTDVQCKVCGRWVSRLSSTHLSRHNGMTVETYLNLFPEPVVTSSQSADRLPTSSEAIHMVGKHPTKSAIPINMVRCAICHADMRALALHLKQIHKIDKETYKKTYPNARTSPVVHIPLSPEEIKIRNKESMRRSDARKRDRRFPDRHGQVYGWHIKDTKPVLGWHVKRVEAQAKTATETPVVKQPQTKATSYSGVYASRKTGSWERFSSKTELARFIQLDADPETLWWSGHYPVYIKGINCVDTYAHHCINVVLKNGTTRIEDVRDRVGNEGVQSILDVKNWCAQNLAHYMLLLSTQVQPNRSEIEQDIDQAIMKGSIKFDATETKEIP